MTNIQFYTHPQSRGCTVRWFLEELGIAYDAHILDYGTTMKEQSYLDINPMGKVPAIVHNGKVVTETSAICLYLADAFFDKGLAPALSDRADYYRWSFFIAGPFEAAFIDGFRKLEIKPEERIMLGYGTIEEMMTILANHLKNREFVAGDKFTAADCLVGAFCAFAIFKGGLENEILKDYCLRLSERPAYKRARAIDEALVK
ncbi:MULTISPECIES: glutathione S-transferase family protein [unclassified Bartonella]|uniref:glutathione S-transferase family protein n=1 Tax=unclassified Bartonella TaxID=2645622 RepID=UPI0015F8F050|nr:MULTISPECIES: glutathione S-transferase family protein [unclassified Bartonella]UXN02640.1 glutathione S-transferase family protein [Bartonella sp. HY406]